MSCFPPELHDERTDIFSELTEELASTGFTSHELTRPFSDAGKVGFLPFSCEGAEETQPIQVSRMLETDHIPSDEEADDLKALVRRVATTELRTRRPKRARTRS